MAEGEGVANAAKSGASGVGRGLASHIGPLPVWGWLLVVGGVGAAYLVFFRGGGAAGGQPTGLLPGLGTGPNGGGIGGGIGGLPPASTTPPPVLANSGWVQTAAGNVAAALGLPLAEVVQYLNEYVNGQAPAGSNQALTEYEKVIQSALGTTGQPPQPIVSGTANPFQSTTQWLQAILAALPAGTSSAIQNEIINLANGATTTLSQAASDAYQNALGIVGQGPNPFTYTLPAPIVPAPGGGPPPAPPPGGLIPTINQTDITNWANATLPLHFNTAADSFANWVNQAPKALRDTFTNAQLANLYNQINQSVAFNPGSPWRNPAYVLATLNAYLANPTLLGNSLPSQLFFYTGGTVLQSPYAPVAPTAGGGYGLGHAPARA